MDISINIMLGGMIIGLFVGSLTGIFGVGGGFLMTPALIILLGVPAPMAVGTGLATFLVNSSLGIIKRRGSGTIDLKLALVISTGSCFGVFVGSKILDALSNAPKIHVLGKEQNTVQFTMLCFFLLLLICIALYLIYDYRQNGSQSPSKRVGLLSKAKLLPYMHFQSLEEPRLSLTALLIIGFFIGVLTGLIGIGGGVIMLPVLIYLVGQRAIKAAGTSLVLVWISSLAAVIIKSGTGEINTTLLLSLLSGGIIGTFAGTKLGLKLAGPKIRLYFVYIILLAVGMIGCKLYFLLK